MKKLMLVAFLVGACDAPEPFQFEDAPVDFAGYKADSAYVEPTGESWSSVDSGAVDSGDPTESLESAPGKQVSNSAVSELIRFSSPVGSQIDTLGDLAVQVAPSIKSVSYWIEEGGGGDAYELASSTDAETGFYVAQNFNVKGQAKVVAKGYDVDGFEVASAWKGIHVTGGNNNAVLPPQVEFVTEKGTHKENPVVLMAVSQGDVHSVRYVCQSDTGGLEWNLGESFDSGAGYGVSFHFAGSSSRVILARALNQAGDVVAEDIIEISVDVPAPNNQLAVGEGCESGLSQDCNGNCVPVGWLGDGYCDAGAIYVADFACEDFGFDGGDCPSAVVTETEDCPQGQVLDCGGVCAQLEWLGDGVCDDGSEFIVDFTCDAFSNDNGDCEGEQPIALSVTNGSVPYFYQYLNEFYPSQSGTMTSLAMLLGHYGYDGNPDDLMSIYGVELSHSTSGLASVFNEVAEAHGISERLKPAANGTIEGVKMILSMGSPVLVHGLFLEEGHAVVVTDYKAGQYTVNDPMGQWNEAFEGAYPFGWNSSIGQGITYAEDLFEKAISSGNGYNTIPVEYYEVIL